MNIKGLVKFSLVDYPGRICCIIFLGHCNFRCPFCHNPHLVMAPETQPKITERKVLNFLSDRQGKLDSVVISGGEPTMNPKLPEFLEKIKNLEYFIKVDTNGSNPDMIINSKKEGLIDSLGIDYKAPYSEYPRLTGTPSTKNMADKIYKTIKFIVENDMDFEVRTTIHKDLLSEMDIATMRNELNSLGVKQWTLQQFHMAETIDPTLKDKPTYSDSELVDIAYRLGNTRVRGITGIYIDNILSQKG